MSGQQYPQETQGRMERPEKAPSKEQNKMTSKKRGASRRACTNCRAAHVACSHTQPCKRCIDKGIEASCIYLARKKRQKPSEQHRPTQPSVLFGQKNPTSTRNVAPVAVLPPFIPNQTVRFSSEPILPESEEDRLLQLLQAEFLQESTMSPIPHETIQSVVDSSDLSLATQSDLNSLQELSRKTEEMTTTLETAMHELQSLRGANPPRTTETQPRISPGPAMCCLRKHLNAMRQQVWSVVSVNQVFISTLQFGKPDVKAGLDANDILTPSSSIILFETLRRCTSAKKEKAVANFSYRNKLGQQTVSPVRTALQFRYAKNGNLGSVILYIYSDQVTWV